MQSCCTMELYRCCQSATSESLRRVVASSPHALATTATTTGGRRSAAAARPLSTGSGPNRRRGDLQVAQSRRARRPFSRPESEYSREKNLLSQSLFSRITGELPEEGQFLTEKEANCDPMERYCSDPYYVYESKCHQCCGTGFSRSRSGGHRSAPPLLITCPDCNGLGMVRHVTTRFFPGEVDEALTVARTQPKAAPPPATAKPKGNPTMLRKPPSYYKPKKAMMSPSSSVNGVGDAAAAPKKKKSGSTGGSTAAAGGAAASGAGISP